MLKYTDNKFESFCFLSGCIAIQLLSAWSAQVRLFNTCILSCLSALDKILLTLIIFLIHSTKVIYCIKSDLKYQEDIFTHVLSFRISFWWFIVASLRFQFIVYLRCHHLIITRPLCLKCHLYFSWQKNLAIKRQKVH